MGSREAFRKFIRFELAFLAEEGKISLTESEIERLAEGMEDDYNFYEQLGGFLVEYIDTFGPNYGIDNTL